MMFVDAIKKDDGYFIPIKGKKEKIKVYLEEDIEGLDILSLLKSLPNKKDTFDEMSKEEFMDQYGEELYRKYLLLDEKTMEENWEYLITSQRDWGDGFEEMEEAISSWREE